MKHVYCQHRVTPNNNVLSCHTLRGGKDHSQFYSSEISIWLSFNFVNLRRSIWSVYPQCCWYLLFNIHFWGNIVDLQCCINFRYTAKWISYTYTNVYSLSFLRLLFHIGHCWILSRVPCATQQILISYLFYIWYCVCVNPYLLIYPPNPLVTKLFVQAALQKSFQMLIDECGLLNALVKVGVLG